MSVEKFLVALRAAREPRRFTCPATGLAVTVRAPSQHEKASAHASVDIRWKTSGREVTALNLDAYRQDIELGVLAQVATHEEKLLGADALGMLERETFEYYADQVAQASSDAELDVSDEEVDKLVAELKKKPSSGEDILSIFAFAKLRAYVRSMAARLSNSPTKS